MQDITERYQMLDVSRSRYKSRNFVLRSKIPLSSRNFVRNFAYLELYEKRKKFMNV